MPARPETADVRHAAEVARIEAAYRERDSTGMERPYRFTNPAYAFYIQLLEWSLLDAFRRTQVDLTRSDALDVGCGTGYFVQRLSDFGARSGTGIDLMPERVAAAQRRYPSQRFVCGNAAELPFEDGEFAIVTQFVCLSSVVDARLRRAIATEMWRVLRPGGIVISYDMRPEPWPIRVKSRIVALRAARQEPRPFTATVRISPQELARLFPDAQLDYRSVGLDFDFCSISARSYLAARLLAAVGPLRAHAIGLLVKPPQGADTTGPAPAP